MTFHLMTVLLIAIGPDEYFFLNGFNQIDAKAFYFGA